MKKGTLSTITLILIFLVGLSLLLYPTVSDYWNSLHQSRAIADYVDQVAELDTHRYDALWAEARKYNEALAKKTDRYEMSDEERREYESLLNVSGNGILGYIEIPVIGCSLPIYHGTNDAVLQTAVGHIEGTSLPVGGEGTHCVISGHRGLPSARLFTDLDKLTEGDRFILRILDETLTYQVDQIRIVEPHKLNDLEIDPDQDYCTLVTCTPYGINTHRLLVRGHRVENAQETQEAHVTSEAIQVDPVLVAPFLAASVVVMLFLLMFIKKRKK